MPSGGQSGTVGLDADVQGYAIDRNVLYPVINGPSQVSNPANNGYPIDIPGVGFDASYAAGHPSALGAASAYKNYGTDGADPGADVAAIAAMESAVKSATLPA